MEGKRSNDLIMYWAETGDGAVWKDFNEIQFEEVI